MNARRTGIGAGILLVAAGVLLIFAAGCYRSARVSGPEGQPPSMAEYPPESGGKEAPDGGSGSSPHDQVVRLDGPGVPAPEGSGTDEGTVERPDESSEESPPSHGEETESAEGGIAGGPSPPAEEERGGEGAAEAEPGEPPPPPSAGKPSGNGGNTKAAKPGSPAAPSAGEAGRSQTVVAMLSEDKTYPVDGPHWARTREELVYKVEFLGITMGYARFTYKGKVLLSGKEAYHLKVRAWTSDILSLIYPINDTIDYYLDVRTLAPLRLEFSKSRKEDDVAIYDQDRGTIVYRYKKDGTIRKKVDAVPNVYDPVSVAYYFRARDLGREEEPRTMYAGRKLWEISARPVGFETIRTDRGEFETVLIQPVLRRGGKIENKGDLRMWMTRDERHVPVRVYAKFKKVRTWTLVGELLPDQQGG